MLQLLRKYQKGIFVVVAIAVILSFSFFGTYSAITSGPRKVKDKQIGKALDGSSIYSQEIASLIRFLKTDVQDVAVLEQGGANFLNDGVLKKDILGTGLGMMLMGHYQEEFHEDLLERMERFKTHRLYSHPDAPFVSMESVWRQFRPEIYEHYKEFVMGEDQEFTSRIETLIALYLDQSNFPPRVTRQLLYYLSQQYRNVIPFDPYIQSGDLALFYAKTAEDWFGPKFIECVAHFIHNAAVYAKEKGYKVSQEEAKASMLQTAKEALKSTNPHKTITSNDFSKHYAQQLYQLGLEEKQAVKLWQKVLLFRRLFDDVGHSVFLDKTLYEQFHAFAQAGVSMDAYAMQSPLRFTASRDLYEFELYMHALQHPTAGKGHPLGIPSVFASAADVMKRFPELVQKRYVLRVASVHRDDIAREVSLREVINWKLVDENWEKLREKFAYLRPLESKEKEARFDYLEALSIEQKAEVDTYVMDAIIDQENSLVRQSLVAKSSKTETIAVPYGGQYASLPGIKDPKALLTLLDEAPLHKEDTSSPEALKAQERLSYYTQDGKHYFRISIIEKSSGPELMTYQEAKERGILSRLVDHELRLTYDSYKTSPPKFLLGADGELMEFSKAKDALCRIVFRSSLKGIQEALRKEGFQDDEATIGKYRFYHHLKTEENRLRIGGEYTPPSAGSLDTHTLGYREPIEAQFQVIKESETYLRKTAHELFDDRVLTLREGDWATILKEGAPYAVFYNVREKVFDDKAMQKGIQNGRYILSNDAKRHLMSKLLAEMDAKEIVVFGSQRMYSD